MLRIIWVTGSECASLAEDPLVSFLSLEPVVERILVSASDSVEEIFERVLATLEGHRSTSDSRAVILIDAFLRPNLENVEDGEWRPVWFGDSPRVAVGRKAFGLLSLDLMWALFPRVRRLARILVSLDGVQVPSSLSCELDSAFLSGRSAGVYSWAWTNRELRTLAEWCR